MNLPKTAQWQKRLQFAQDQGTLAGQTLQRDDQVDQLRASPHDQGLQRRMLGVVMPAHQRWIYTTEADFAQRHGQATLRQCIYQK